MTLSDRAYLTVAEVKEWLNIADSNTAKDNQLIRHINTACHRVESFIDGPVLSREYVAYSDGNNSNVVMPAYWPVIAITEIKIDFNRSFGTASALAADNYVLRGLPPLAGSLGDIAVTVSGSDVVLRDDANTSILGRVFSGSSVQSIKMTYTAGHGTTAADLPDDLKSATLMLVEFLYMTKENRELGVASKGTMGQSYHKRAVGESGMPEEIEGMLAPYVDHSLPDISSPQRNNFRI